MRRRRGSVRQASAGRHSEWLALVEMSGLMFSEPVLEEKIGELPRMEPAKLKSLRKAWDRYNLRPGMIPTDVHREWIEFVLGQLLELQEPRWRTGPRMGERFVVVLPELGQTLAPERVLVDLDDSPLMLFSVYPRGMNLDKVESETGRWRASPTTKFSRLLVETDVPIGLLTNGDDWRLVYAPRGAAMATVTWDARSWLDRLPTLDAFVCLLDARRWFTESEDRSLLAIIRESQDRQADVTDQLGEQVGQAVELFVRALDVADRETGGRLLDGIPEATVFEASLTLMMRLVFLLYAEENRLLPHGNPFYDQSYGVVHLWKELSAQRRVDREGMRQRFDAWDRLLALFRIIHAGCDDPDLNLRAYGGHLFDPDAFPFLEGRRPGSTWQDGDILEPPRITNETVWQLLKALRIARVGGRRGIPQRVSYRTLDVEQLGHVYEGLIESTVVRAGQEPEWFWQGREELRGRDDGWRVVFDAPGQPIRPLVEIDDLEGDALVSWLKGVTGKTPAAIRRALANQRPPDETDSHPPEADDEEDSGDEPDPERVRKVAPFLAWPGIIEPGSLYVIGQGGFRKRQGTYYTPTWVTRFIIERTLEPLVHDGDGETRRVRKPEEILALNVCDPAMGSGAFLVQACRYLAEKLVESWELIESGKPDVRLTVTGEVSRGHPEEQLVPEDRDDRMALALRLVVNRCIYGVDINPLAVELAKVSLWLATLSKNEPFTFLDHRLKCGNSLIGAGRLEHERYPAGNIDAPARDQWSCWKRDNARRDARKALNVLHRFIIKEAREKKAGVRPLPFGEPPHMETVTAHACRILEEIERMPVRDQDAKEERYRALERDAGFQGLRRMFDGWCALWFWPVDGNTTVADVPTPHDWEVYRWCMFQDEKALLDEKHRRWRNTATAVSIAERFFHWELEFPDVFTGEHGGFDAVFANPPYVAMYSRESVGTGNDVSAHKIYYLSQLSNIDGEDLLGGRVNYFLLFIVQAMRIARGRGRCCFVLPDTLITNESYEGVRRFLCSKRFLEDVWLFKNPVFHNATVGTCVVAWDKGGTRRVTLHDVADHDPSGIVSETVVQVSHHDLLERPHCNWQPVSNDGPAFACAMLKLGDIAHIKDGINPGSKAVRQRLLCRRPDSPSCKRLIEGGDILPFKIRWNDKWVLYDPGAISKEEKKKGTSLRQRWIFESPKIVYRQTAPRPIAAVDLSRHYTLNSVHNIILREHNTNVLFALCAYMNTETCASIYQGLTGEVRKVFPQVHISSMRTLPVPEVLANADHPITRKLSDLARILSKDNESARSSTVKDDIERIVSELVWGSPPSR